MGILVTGANKGIGLAICQQLITHKNVHVILGCRNFAHVVQSKDAKDKKDAANYELQDVGKSDKPPTRIEILRDVRFKDVKNIDFVEIDIANKESVKKAAESVKAKYKTIDILVNNAGMAFKGNAFDINVVNTTLETNYFGTVNVTEAFLPLIKDNGKIIMTSSRAGCLNRGFKDPSNSVQAQKLLSSDLTQKDLENILDDFKAQVENDKSLPNSQFKSTAYGMSKIAMSAYSRIIGKQMIARNIFMAAYCPGWVNTFMSSGSGTRSPAQGAKGLELLCTEKMDMKVTGKFWGVEFQGSKVETGKLVNYDWTQQGF